MDSPWFPFSQLESSQPERLFCFPYGGGNPHFYRQWQEHMPTGVEIVPVQLPGRGIRFHEENFMALQSLLDALAVAIRPYLDRPFTFFGHSMGSLVSYELASLLYQRDHKQPQHLFVSGFHAPHLPDPNPPIYHLPDEQFLEEVIAKNGMPPEIIAKEEYLQLFLPCLRADFTVAETYRHQPRPPLTCPITIFGGRDDHEANAADLDAWKSLTTGSFERIMMPGDHFFIHSAEEQLVTALVERMP